MLSVDMRYNSTFCQYGVLIHVSLCEEREMLEKNDRVAGGIKKYFAGNIPV